MVLRCLVCGMENSATNFYCGQCGVKLHRSSAEAADRAPVQSERETETDARAKEEAERKRRTEIARWKEIDLESRGIFMPWNLTDPAADPARDAARGDTELSPVSEARASQLPDSRNEEAGEKRVEARIPVATSKSPAPPPAVAPQPRDPKPPDPQASDPEPSEEDSAERESESHPLRDIAIIALVAGVILASAEWRSIRDHALAYLHQAYLHPGAEQPVSQTAGRQPAGEAVVPAVAASGNTSAPVKQPSAAVRPGGRSIAGVPPAGAGASPAPGAAEMYQAAHADDPQLRAAWLWKAVRAGNPQATVELAKMYAEGDGVAQSCNQARVLLSAAAARGNAQAKLDLDQLHGCSQP